MNPLLDAYFSKSALMSAISLSVSGLMVELSVLRSWTVVF